MSKGVTYIIAKKLMKRIDVIVRVLTTIDLAIYVLNIIFSLFMGVQKGTLVEIEMNIWAWVSLIVCLLQSLISLWFTKVVIGNGFSLPTLKYYNQWRLGSFVLADSLCILSFFFQLLSHQSTFGIVALSFVYLNLVAFSLQLVYVILTTYLYHIYCFTI